MTPQQLHAATQCGLKTAEKWQPAIDAAMAEFGIASALQQAAFIAQIAHESGRFCYVKEIWGPTPAQRRYEGRKDLGNVQTGDGKRFMGRGLIQITGRTNYRFMSAKLGLDLINNPELLEQPSHAVRSAAAWWASKGLNDVAQSGDFLRVTKIINGGCNGLKDRQEIWATAKQALAVA